MRTLGLDPAGVSVARYLYDPADKVRSRETALRYQSSLLSLVCENDQDWILLDEELTYLCPSQVPGQAMAGRDLIVRMELTDREGRKLVDERTIHPDCPAGDTVCESDTQVGCAAP